MRLLPDNNLSPRLVDYLNNAGHDAQHVRDHGLQAAPDEAVLNHARANARVLVSADTDFGSLLARTGAERPPLILVRRSQARRADEVSALLLANLDQIAEDLQRGAIVVVTDTDLRIRRLPVPPGRVQVPEADTASEPHPET